MKMNEIKVGKTVRYAVTRQNVVITGIRKAIKDHFGDVMTPATITFESVGGKCWDAIDNFEEAR